MAASSVTLSLVVVFLVTIQSGLSCRYFCRDPVNAVYHCCDDGTTTPSQGEDSNDTTEANTQGDDGVMPYTITVVEHGPEDGARYNVSSGCRYYCAYGNSVYCCDDGSLKMPDDHDSNNGRCPSLLEQVCKDDAVYLHRKSRKFETTKSGSAFLGKIGEGEVMCASDGYCPEDERCCPSACHKRHICLKSVVIDKSKN